MGVAGLTQIKVAQIRGRKVGPYLKELVLRRGNVIAQKRFCPKVTPFSYVTAFRKGLHLVQ